MAFKIDSTIVISDVPDIVYTQVVNAPATRAKLTIACANGGFVGGNVSMSGSTLIIRTS